METYLTKVTSNHQIQEVRAEIPEDLIEKYHQIQFKLDLTEDEIEISELEVQKLDIEKIFNEILNSGEIKEERKEFSGFSVGADNEGYFSYDD